jgi:hypothetical protein
VNADPPAGGSSHVQRLEREVATMHQVIARQGREINRLEHMVRVHVNAFKFSMWLGTTVKNYNFGPHVAFGLIISGVCYYQNASYRKMNEMELLENL